MPPSSRLYCLAGCECYNTHSPRFFSPGVSRLAHSAEHARLETIRLVLNAWFARVTIRAAIWADCATFAGFACPCFYGLENRFQNLQDSNSHAALRRGFSSRHAETSGKGFAAYFGVRQM